MSQEKLISFEHVPLGARIKYPGKKILWTVIGKRREVDGKLMVGVLAEHKEDMRGIHQWSGQSICSHIPTDQGGDCPDMVLWVN